jgi:hypothetical protein
MGQVYWIKTAKSGPTDRYDFAKKALTTGRKRQKMRAQEGDFYELQNQKNIFFKGIT